MKQVNKYGQTVELVLEHVNGEQAQPALQLRRLLKTQDLEAWKQSPEEFRNWIAQGMFDYFKSLEVKLVTR